MIDINVVDEVLIYKVKLKYNLFQSTSSSISRPLCEVREQTETDETNNLFSEHHEVDDEKLYMTFHLNNLSTYDQGYSHEETTHMDIETKVFIFIISV